MKIQNLPPEIALKWWSRSRPKIRRPCISKLASEAKKYFLKLMLLLGMQLFIINTYNLKN